MIIVRTNHDLATSYTYAWTTPIIKEVEQRGLTIATVEGADVNMQNFQQRVQKIKPRFIMLNGHGSASSFYDNNGKELVNLESSHVFKNTIAFARACDCIQKLGVAAVAKGCKAFIGYRRKFLIPRWHWRTCTPLEDAAAKPVMHCSNTVVLELLKNKSVEEAVERSHTLVENYIVELIYSAEPYSAATLQALVHNDSSLSAEGDATARISV